MTITTEPSDAVRDEDAAAGLHWYQWTDEHPTAPFVLHLYRRGATRPMAVKYFASERERSRHLLHCRARHTARRKTKLTPTAVLMSASIND